MRRPMRSWRGWRCGSSSALSDSGRYVRSIRNGSGDAEARTGGNLTRVPGPVAESPGAVFVQTRPRKMFNVRWTLKFSLLFFALIALWTGGVLAGILPNVLGL